MRRYSNWLSTSAASSISVATSPAAAAAALALVGLPPSSTELPLSLPVTRCRSLSCLLASLAAWLALTSLPS